MECGFRLRITIMQTLSGRDIDRYLLWAAGLAYLVAGLDLAVWLAHVAGVYLPITWRTGLDAVIFAILAFGIGRRSRLAAVLLAAYWIATKWELWLQFHRVSALLGLVVGGYVFVQGARAVFLARRQMLIVAESTKR
jgi:hypothetical protein